MDLISFIKELTGSIDINKFIPSYGTQVCHSGKKFHSKQNNADIILITDGSGIMEIFGETLKITKNNCLIISGQAFSLLANSPGSCTFIHLGLDFTAAGLPVEDANIYTFLSPGSYKMLTPPVKNNGNFIRLADCIEIQPLVKNILYELASQESYHTILLKLLLGELLLLLARNFEKQISETVNTTNSYIANTIDYINNHISQELSTQSIAKAVHLSPDYLHHIFKAYTGCSLMEYVNSKRMEKCKLLLKQTSLSISDIAVEVGISTSQYLSTLFKKFTSSSPKSYRRGCIAANVYTVFPIKINCGGAQADGLASDKPYKKGGWGYVGNTMVYSVEDFVEPHHGYPSGLKSLRYGGIFSYRFDVPNGVYDVKLVFAEIYFTSANARTFQIKINGKIVQDYLDIFCAAKDHHAGVLKVFKDIEVCDGNLEIEFISIQNYAQVNVIEVAQNRLH